MAPYSRRPSGARGNAFLDSLSASDAALIIPLLVPIHCRTGERLGHDVSGSAVIYFPTTLVASVGLGGDGSGVGLVGREGLIGWTAMLDRSEAGEEARALFDGGTALTLPVKRMRIACFASPTLSMDLLRFVQSYAVQLSCSVRSSNSATLKQRLSAWLLMLHDRLEGDAIAITHEALAQQLRVRRASITDLLHILEGELALRCERRTIHMRDRSQLEASAGRAYGGGANRSRPPRVFRSPACNGERELRAAVQ